MKKKILVRGPVLSQSGYGEQSRFALRALRSREDLFDIFILPIAWGKTGWIWEESEFREWMDEKITLTQVLIQRKQLQIDISLQVTIPNEFEKIAPINIGYTAGIETHKCSPQWLPKCNDMDKEWVVSNNAKPLLEKQLLKQQINKQERLFLIRLRHLLMLFGRIQSVMNLKRSKALSLSTTLTFLLFLRSLLAKTLTIW